MSADTRTPSSSEDLPIFRGFPGSSHAAGGATFDESKGAARASADARAAIGRPEIAAGDRGSHFSVLFSMERIF
jgi:hypothetical protein